MSPLNGRCVPPEYTMNPIISHQWVFQFAKIDKESGQNDAMHKTLKVFPCCKGLVNQVLNECQ